MKRSTIDVQKAADDRDFYGQRLVNVLWKREDQREGGLQ